jgi:hypothetical protein
MPTSNRLRHLPITDNHDSTTSLATGAPRQADAWHHRHITPKSTTALRSTIRASGGPPLRMAPESAVKVVGYKGASRRHRRCSRQAQGRDRSAVCRVLRLDLYRLACFRTTPATRRDTRFSRPTDVPMRKTHLPTACEQLRHERRPSQAEKLRLERMVDRRPADSVAAFRLMSLTFQLWRTAKQEMRLAVVMRIAGLLDALDVAAPWAARQPPAHRGRSVLLGHRGAHRVASSDAAARGSPAQRARRCGEPCAVGGDPRRSASRPVRSRPGTPGPSRGHRLAARRHRAQRSPSSLQDRLPHLNSLSEGEHRRGGHRGIQRQDHPTHHVAVHQVHLSPSDDRAVAALGVMFGEGEPVGLVGVVGHRTPRVHTGQRERCGAVRLAASTWAPHTAR